MNIKIKIIATLLCIVLAVGVLAFIGDFFHPPIKVNEPLKVPDTASKDFGGVMLSNYDSLLLEFSKDSIRFVPDSLISLSEYDYVCIDIIDTSFYPDDLYQTTLSLNFDDNHSKYLSQSYFISTDFVFESNGIFGDLSYLSLESVVDYSIIFDVKNASSDSIKYFTYVNGEVVNSGSLSLSEYSTIYSISWEYDNSAEIYDNSKIGGINIYAFEHGSACSLDDYFLTGSLYSCKDSLLYGTA